MLSPHQDVDVYKDMYSCSQEEAAEALALHRNILRAIEAKEESLAPARKTAKEDQAAKDAFSLKLFDPKLGGTVITHTDYLEFNVKSSDGEVVDAPLTPEVFGHIYRVFLRLEFQYVKTVKNGVYRVVWGNFNCMIPPWKLRYESGAAKASDILAKSSDIFKRDSLFFPFFEDSGWAWLLVVRLGVPGKLEMSVYDFSSGANKAVHGTMKTVVRFLQEAWYFFNPGKKMPINLNDKFQIKMETTTQTDVTMSGWVMLHVFECLAISSTYPSDIKQGVMEMREWFRDALLGEDLSLVEIISFKPEQLARLSRLAGCDLK